MGTSKGQRVQSVDLDGSVRPVSIDAEALGERCEVFWQRIPFTLPMYYREIIGSGNCCVEISSFVSKVPRYEGDLQEGREFLDNLLAEATCLKQWTIPFGAYVQLNAGEIEAAKLHEVGNDVSVLLVNRAGDYFLVWVNPAGKHFSFASGLELANALGACATAKLKADGKDPFSPEGEISAANSGSDSNWASRSFWLASSATSGSLRNGSGFSVHLWRLKRALGCAATGENRESCICLEYDTSGTATTDWMIST